MADNDNELLQMMEPPTIGLCLRRIRELRELTLGDVARAVDVGAAQVSAWELDRDPMSERDLERYLRALFHNEKKDVDKELFLHANEAISRLEARVQELLERNTELALELRQVDWQRGVREFHVGVVEHTLPDYPAVPPEPILRRQARLITEEYFETMQSIYVSGNGFELSRAKEIMNSVVDKAPLYVNFPELMDATFDLTYVTIGMFCWCGVDAQGMWTVGQASNMAKAGGPRRASDGKMLKPPGWKPPDFKAEIERQKREAVARGRGPK